MPTGYTATLVEKGQTFETFVMGCARAFGACISLRDEGSDTPIPEKFTPSTYHVEALAKAKSDVKRLEGFSRQRQQDFGAKERTRHIKEIKTWIAKSQTENKRIDGMVAKVQAWKPPTKDHEELKAFMLQQLSISRNTGDYQERELKQATSRPAQDYYEAAVRSAERGVIYHQEEMAKEINRADSRTGWVRELRNSLK